MVCTFITVLPNTQDSACRPVFTRLVLQYDLELVLNSSFAVNYVVVRAVGFLLCTSYLDLNCAFLLESLAWGMEFCVVEFLRKVEFESLHCTTVSKCELLVSNCDSWLWNAGVVQLRVIICSFDF